MSQRISIVCPDCAGPLVPGEDQYEDAWICPTCNAEKTPTPSRPPVTPAKCPVSAQELRVIAARHEDSCRDANNGQVCESCRKEAEQIRTTAAWLEKEGSRDGTWKTALVKRRT